MNKKNPKLRLKNESDELRELRNVIQQIIEAREA
jgi:hypothetical protein